MIPKAHDFLRAENSKARPERSAHGRSAHNVALSVLLGIVLTAVVEVFSEVSFRNTSPEVDYVGSEVCSGCHASISEQFRKTGMGQSMSLPPSRSQLDKALPSTVVQPQTSRHFQVYREGSNLYQSQWELDSAGREIYRITHKLEFVFGSGANGQSYAVHREGALFQAPLSYYAKPKKWDLSPGFESSEIGFNRPILAGCVTCHSGRANAIRGKSGFYSDPAFSELAIGCENCHGPGQLHVKERAAGLSVSKTGNRTIVNPARLPGWLADNICMNCHQTGDTRVLQPGKDYLDFRPGQPLDETVGIFRVPYQRESPPDEDLLEHYSSMVLSRCYRQSRGQLGCISCHNPHAEPGPQEAAAYYRGKCFQCHTDKSCSVPFRERLQQRSANDCASCHLPKRPIKTIAHSALTNHRILARPNQQLPEDAFQAPAALPGIIHVNAVPGKENKPVPLLTQLQVYGELLSQRPDYQKRYLGVLNELSKTDIANSLVFSALARKHKLEGTAEGNRLAIQYLSKALEAGSTSENDYQDLAGLLIRAGEIDQAIATLKTGIEVAPFNGVFYKTLALQYIHQKNYAKALEAMKRHLDLFPEDNFMRKLIRQAESAPAP
jgi:hypothetical protein